MLWCVFVTKFTLWDTNGTQERHGQTQKVGSRPHAPKARAATFPPRPTAVYLIWTASTPVLGTGAEYRRPFLIETRAILPRHHNPIEYAISSKATCCPKRLLLRVRQPEEANDHDFRLTWISTELLGRIHQQTIALPTEQGALNSTGPTSVSKSAPGHSRLA